MHKSRIIQMCIVNDRFRFENFYILNLTRACLAIIIGHLRLNSF